MAAKSATGDQKYRNNLCQNPGHSIPLKEPDIFIMSIEFQTTGKWQRALAGSFSNGSHLKRPV
ncbi:MAG TPA: hypothetical protein VFB79_15295 [Candidatus Angelobacter sp.]|nr:hypothetical protein [Candidatus Angelobacter sp.]